MRKIYFVVIVGFIFCLHSGIALCGQEEQYFLTIGEYCSVESWDGGPVGFVYSGIQGGQLLLTCFYKEGGTAQIIISPKKKREFMIAGKWFEILEVPNKWYFQFIEKK